MEFRILGPLEVADEARSVALPRGRGRALLALLILRAGEVLSTDLLIDELWGPAPPPTAPKALQNLVSVLRKRLDHGRDGAASMVRTSPPGYALLIDPAQVDANRFRRLVARANGAPPPQKAAQLEAALALWRGPALAEFTYEPFAQTAITALTELRLTALEERIEAYLETGRHTDVIAEIEALLGDHPLRERVRGHLMLALYRCGRQAEALAVFREGRRVLGDELGIEPGVALRDLHDAILRHDPSLDVPGARRATRPPARPPAAGGPWLDAGRKQVTILVAALTESATAAGRSDPEAVRAVVRRGLDAASEVLRRHGGTVETYLGDVAVAVFGAPVSHEDDPLRAVRAAVELRRCLRALNDELGRERDTGLAARMGITTGEVVVGGAGTQVSGEATNTAVRLQQAAGAGEILVGEATRRLVGDAVVVEPVDEARSAGGGGPDAGWRLVDVVAGAPARPLRLDTPMVGRARELARLRAVFEQVVRERRARLVTVVGEPGVGKSRLALELATALEPDAMAVAGHCPAYGNGITFWPLREIVTEVTGGSVSEGLAGLLAGEEDADPVGEQVAGAIGPGGVAGPPGELFPAVRRVFETLAHRRPLLVTVEDVHWAQPTFLDLVGYLAGSARGPMLLLCLARTEFLERHGVWAEARGRGAVLSLGPLGPEASRKLVTDRLAGRRLAHQTEKGLLRSAQGNPLFLEQMLAAIRTEGPASAGLTMPPSLQALLAARLDRLGPAERDLLRCASVVGSTFSADALAAIVPDEARPFVDRHLRALEARELVHRSGRPFLGGPAFAFRHVLIQAAAYRSVTRQGRAELHERFAGWLERAAGASLPELDEVVGYHLEQATEQRRHLGLADEHSRALPVRAGERLASAGLRAYRRFDVAAVENLLTRALALLPRDHPRRREIVGVLPEVYQVLGRHRDAEAVLAEMLEAARAHGDSGSARWIHLERARTSLVTGSRHLDDVGREAERAMARFEAAGDDAGVAQTAHVLGLVHLRRGELRRMERVARRGLDRAIRLRRPRDEAANRWFVAIALVDGDTPVATCVDECEALARTPGGGDHPGVLTELAYLHAMREDFERARELIRRARTLFLERVRGRRPLMFLAQRHAQVEVLAGDLTTAVDELRTALALAREMGEPDEVAELAACLSRLLPRGSSEAEQLARQSADAAPAGNVTARVLSLAAGARVLADRGDPVQARDRSREAVRLAPPEMLNLGAELREVLAGVLLATGQPRTAWEAAGEAVELYERKGNLVGATRARAGARGRDTAIP